MNLNPGNFPAGVSGNPNGRPTGTRNRRDRELIEQLKARGDIDSADFLSSIVTDPSNEKSLRVTAASYLLPYQHAKVQSVPALVFIIEPVELPHSAPTNIYGCIANISHIGSLFRAGTLDLASRDAMAAEQEAIIDGFKALGLDDASQDQVIHIKGGLPSLPGTNVTMPQLNGHTVELEAPNVTQIQSTPHQPEGIPPASDAGSNG
jgi:hypothetical protein